MPHIQDRAGLGIGAGCGADVDTDATMEGDNAITVTGAAFDWTPMRFGTSNELGERMGGEVTCYCTTWSSV